MLKSISFKKLAVLSAGIAIVLSSCGLQNTAGESSGSGKTKNFALVNGFCFDSIDQWEVAFETLFQAALALENGTWIESVEQIKLMSQTNPVFNPDGTITQDQMAVFEVFFAGIQDGVPCPVGTTFAEASNIPVVPLQSNGLPKDCYPQDYIDATIAGFEQQRDKPDASDAYKAEMQQGIDTLKATCVLK